MIAILRPRGLMDVLEVHYRDDKQKARTARFAFLKYFHVSK